MFQYAHIGRRKKTSLYNPTTEGECHIVERVFEGRSLGLFD